MGSTAGIRTRRRVLARSGITSNRFHGLTHLVATVVPSRPFRTSRSTKKVDACKTAIQHALARSTRLQLSQSNCQWKFAALSAIALQTSGYRDKHHETWSFICFNICVFNFIMALSMVAIYKLQFKKTSGEVMADAVFRCPLVETPTSASIILLEPADSLALKVQESRRYFVANKLSCFPGRPEDESRKIMSQ